MTPRSLIFVSAVSRELRSARQLVANTLTFLGYQPVWQDIFGTEEGDLRGMLRQQIDQCKGVVQLVGQNYGAESPAPDEEFGRVSYTQYEALYARKRGKKVWYLFIDEDFPIDAHEPEPEELRRLQSAYRQRLQSDTHVYHPLTTTEGLEASVLKLRDDLVHLRRGVKQWALGITALLLIIVALAAWQLHSQAEMRAEIAKLREGINAYPRMEALAQAQITETRRAPGITENEQADLGAQSRPSRAGENQAAIEQRVYAELGKQLGLDPKVLREKLPKFAEQLRQSPNASSFERANAAYVTKDYPEAERLALQATADTEKSVPPKSNAAIAGLKLAGLSAQKQIRYARAMEHFRDAEKLTDRGGRPAEWADLQHAIADLLIDQGQYASAEKTLQDVVLIRSKVLGPDQPDTLRSRNRLAYALFRQGRYTEAEVTFREVIAAEEKVLGPEDPDTLSSRHGAANTLMGEGKYAAAEAQYRQVLALQEKVLGPEHPDTLASRDDFAYALFDQGKSAEAVVESRRVLELMEKALGPEHPETLTSRNNLAVMLQSDGNYVDAEAQFRQLIKLQAKILGPENPDTLTSHNNLADALIHEGKYAEAEAEILPAVKLRETTSGPEDPETLSTRDTLACALAGEGRYAEAEAQYRDLIRLEEKVVGAEHPLTLASRNGLARTLLDQGKEAETEMRRIIQLREKMLGPTHPDTLESCYDFARGLLRQNKIPEAKEFALRAAEGARQVLGPDHPSTQKYEKLLTDFQVHR